MLPNLVAAFVASALLGWTGPADAKVIEEQIRVPVRVTDAHGKAVAQNIVVTLFHDDRATKPYPIMVINHGRSVTVAEHSALGRVRLPSISRWFAEMGFMVALPTRVGYGVSGGEDVENSGTCNSKNYPPVYAASAAQTLQVLAVVRARKDVSGSRAVVLGQSFGGTTAITLAALDPPGIEAAINFAGGGGGRPDTHPQNPCGQPQLKRLFADYGKTARMPTLWIYSENDKYFGSKLPQEWFAAFRAAGGIGEYTLFPPFGDNGHLLFYRAPELWQPRVLQFLHDHGFPHLRPK